MRSKCSSPDQCGGPIRSSGVATRWRMRGMSHDPRSMRATSVSQSGARSKKSTVTIVDRRSGSFSMFHISASESLMWASKRSTSCGPGIALSCAMEPACYAVQGVIGGPGFSVKGESPRSSRDATSSTTRALARVPTTAQACASPISASVRATTFHGRWNRTRIAIPPAARARTTITSKTKINSGSTRKTIAAIAASASITQINPSKPSTGQATAGEVFRIHLDWLRPGGF